MGVKHRRNRKVIKDEDRNIKLVSYPKKVRKQPTKKDMDFNEDKDQERKCPQNERSELLKCDSG